jgi:protoporphyrinogen/coproporphyrinogen III oxidase
MGERFTQIHLGEDSDGAAAPLKATHVISALPLPVLDSILLHQQSGARTLPHLRANPHSTVIVLNLVFPAPPNGTATTTQQQLHPPGFGYLIPRPEQGYPVAESEHEPPSLLGVVFDSASLPEQDDEFGTGALRFIKMSAMLGGPYPLPPSPSGTPDEEADRALLATVLPLISAQLGGDTPLPEPLYYAVHRNVESIPTYLVGHTSRVTELRQALRERWGDRMKVVGAGVGGVSVADCVKAGRQAAREVGAQIDL